MKLVCALLLLLCPVASFAAPPAASVSRAALTRAAEELVRRDAALLESVIRKLPKVDLHRHLEGAIRPETFLRVAAKHSIELPAQTVEGLRPFVSMTANDHTLSDFLSKFSTIAKMWVNLEAVEEISKQCVLDAHQENVVAVELRFAPHSMARLKGLDPRLVTEAVIRGVRAGEKETGVVAGLVMIIPRQLAPEVALQIVALAAEFASKGVAGIDLAANEFKFPPAPFAPAFREAERLGLRRTLHAGEALGPESVRVAIEDCHAERIGHGVRVFSDAPLVDRILKSGIVLEMCPTSNVQTGAVASLKDHPLKKFVDMGGRATVNTDDPGVCDTDMNKELLVAVRDLGCSLGDVESMMVTAAEAMFLPADKRAALRSAVRARIDEVNAGLVAEGRIAR